MPFRSVLLGLSLAVSTWLAACSSGASPSPSSAVGLETNFSHQIVDDSTITIAGEAYPLIDGFEQMYLVADTLFYVKQVSTNNYLVYNYQSDRIENRFGLVVSAGDVVYAVARTPGYKSVRPLGDGPAHEVAPDSVGPAQFVTAPEGRPLTLRDSSGYTRGASGHRY